MTFNECGCPYDCTLCGRPMERASVVADQRTEIGKLRIELEAALGEVAYWKGQAAWFKARPPSGAAVELPVAKCCVCGQPLDWKHGSCGGTPHHLDEIDEWRKANPVKT